VRNIFRGISDRFRRNEFGDEPPPGCWIIHNEAREFFQFGNWILCRAHSTRTCTSSRRVSRFFVSREKKMRPTAISKQRVFAECKCRLHRNIEHSMYTALIYVSWDRDDDGADLHLTPRVTSAETEKRVYSPSSPSAAIRAHT